MLSLIVKLVFLTVTAIPAYVGAGVGWDSAHISGKDPIEGAGTGAYWATTISILTATAIAAVLIVVCFSGLHDGGEAGILIGIISYVITGGILASIIVGMLAGFGAKFGARRSRSAARQYATAATAIGFLVLPFILAVVIMFGLENERHHNRRHSLLEHPPAATLRQATTGVSACVTIPGSKPSRLTR
jgi:hypothetical protein